MANSTQFRAQFKIPEADLKVLRSALSQLAVGVRRRVSRQGIRKWLTDAKSIARSSAYSKAKATKRNLIIKVKTYKRTIIWGAVGVRVSSNSPGWRSHLYDGGWRPWRKGFDKDGKSIKPTKPMLRKFARKHKIAPFIAKNRGWRAGKRKRGLGAVTHRHMYLTETAKIMARHAAGYIMPYVMKAIHESRNRG